MKLQIFNGGQASRLAPQLIQQNQGVVFENIDNAVGVLASVKDSLPTSELVKEFHKYFTAEDKWISSDDKTDYLEFQRVMYATTAGQRPTKTSSGVTSFLGIEKPSTPLSLLPIGRSTPLTELTVLADLLTGDLPTSDFAYRLFNIKDNVAAAPLEITVKAGLTETTKATAEVLSVKHYVSSSGFYYPVYGYTGAPGKLIPITTRPKLTNRALVFSDIKGVFADSAKLYRFYNDEWRLVHEFTATTESYTDDVEDISANELLDQSLASVFNGTYQYTYTYYNSSDGTESRPASLTAEFSALGGAIEIGNLNASPDPQVDKIRLYRIGGNLTELTLHTEFDNVATTYTDRIKDSDLDGRLLESGNFSEAPSGLRFLSESYAMLFGALGSTLRFTPIGNPNAWPEEYSLQFNSEITGIGAVANGLLVMTEFKTHIVTGTGPFSLAQQSLRGDQGCISFDSIQESDRGTLIWASADGLCTSSGNNVVNLTKSMLGEVRLAPTSSAVVDEAYYCHLEDGRTLCWDYRFDVIPKYLNLGIQNVTTAKSKLYGWASNVLSVMFKGTESLTFRYVSPRFIEGSITEAKTYKKVYIRSEGDIIIIIKIDDEIVSTTTLSSKDTHMIQIPQDLQRGYYIQFEVSGKGTVDEIEYRTGRRQNG